MLGSEQRLDVGRMVDNIQRQSENVGGAGRDLVLVLGTVGHHDGARVLIFWCAVCAEWCVQFVGRLASSLSKHDG